MAGNTLVTAAPAPSGTEPARTLTPDVACPFCGILCDDLEIAHDGNGLSVIRNSCPKAKAGFETPAPASTPMIAGRPASVADAVAAAAGILRAAKCPGFGGLALDVEGMRAIMALADRTGGIVDHALSEGQFRNLNVLQSGGWFMSTLTETRNRADLIVIVGCDAEALHPRFMERVVAPADTMFEGRNRQRTVVFLGRDIGRDFKPGGTVGEVVHVGCDNAAVGAVLDAVRARLKGLPVTAPVAGVALGDIEALMERCRSAGYGVMAWAPASLAFPDADLTVQIVAELVKDLNKTTRFAGLSLGANEGAATAAAVCAWQSGYPLRVSFASGAPLYDTKAYALPRAIADGAVDALIWAAAFTADITPPPQLPKSMPLVLLGTPALVAAQGARAAVAIPIGTPGLDHAGRLVRCDGVVTLPLRNLRRSSLPGAATVVAQIAAAVDAPSR